MRWLTFLDESIKVHSFIKMFRQTLNVKNNYQQSISNAEYAPYVLIELTESINLRHNFYFVWSKYGYVNTIMSNSKINTKVWIFFSTTCTHGIRRGGMRRFEGGHFLKLYIEILVHPKQLKFFRIQISTMYNLFNYLAHFQDLMLS